MLQSQWCKLKLRNY